MSRWTNLFVWCFSQWSVPISFSMWDHNFYRRWIIVFQTNNTRIKVGSVANGGQNEPGTCLKRITVTVRGCVWVCALDCGSEVNQKTGSLRIASVDDEKYAKSRNVELPGKHRFRSCAHTLSTPFQSTAMVPLWLRGLGKVLWGVFLKKKVEIDFFSFWSLISHSVAPVSRSDFKDHFDFCYVALYLWLPVCIRTVGPSRWAYTWRSKLRKWNDAHTHLLSFNFNKLTHREQPTSWPDLITYTQISEAETSQEPMPFLSLGRASCGCCLLLIAHQIVHGTTNE